MRVQTKERFAALIDAERLHPNDMGGMERVMGIEPTS